MPIFPFIFSVSYFRVFHFQIPIGLCRKVKNVKDGEGNATLARSSSSSSFLSPGNDKRPLRRGAAVHNTTQDTCIMHIFAINLDLTASPSPLKTINSLMGFWQNGMEIDGILMAPIYCSPS
jgi:hypothetical protein